MSLKNKKPPKWHWYRRQRPRVGDRVRYAAVGCWNAVAYGTVRAVADRDCDVKWYCVVSEEGEFTLKPPRYVSANYLETTAASKR